jgi:DNA adenine methylase
LGQAKDGNLNKPALLRWAGSKKQILPSIKKYWNDEFERYVEPFCGSASLFFDIRPRKASLSDINGDLINTFVQLQSNHASVANKLAYLPTDKESYYGIRSMDSRSLSMEDQAVRFIYLNSLCFNGLYRVNKLGKFNVPYGSKHRKELFDEELLQLTAQALNSAVVKTQDFESAVDGTVAGDFIYLDPPYATACGRIFTEYQKDAFARSDIQRLNLSLERAHSRGVKFVLSYADVAEIECFNSQWSVARVSARRNIAGFSGSRKIISEVLISNIEVQ